MGTRTEKGQAFEAKVARWARKEFGAVLVKQNQLFKGKTAVRPFEVDIVLWTKAGVVAAEDVIWIECKDRKASIKRTDIFKLLESARDVKRTVGPTPFVRMTDKRGEEWDYLVFVSTAKFDADAVNFAEKNNVACYYHDGRAFQKVVGFKRSWF